MDRQFHNYSLNIIIKLHLHLSNKFYSPSTMVRNSVNNNFIQLKMYKNMEINDVLKKIIGNWIKIRAFKRRGIAYITKI